jgi:2-dehydro-3-deoxyphosphooctonate aldolase (KDO 8-P synthase)
MALFDPEKLLLIAGPCSLENEGITVAVAEHLVALGRSFPRLTIVFKGSFDKANRSSIHSGRGPGMEEGMRLLRMVRERYGLPVTTDIHVPAQAETVGEVCDVLQIPAFLCRQTDMLVEAARTGRVVSVKKGQFLSPMDMEHVVHKLRESGAREVWQIERGTTFGYGNLVVDMRSFALMKTNGHPVIFDATHSVQLPGSLPTGTGGDGRFIPILAKAALASGADGLFFEVHPNPSAAICDAANQVSLADFPAVATQCVSLWDFLAHSPEPQRL